MSIAPRDAKCSIRRRTCAGHWLFTQRTATWPSSFTTALPHSGQCFGIRNFLLAPRPQIGANADDRGNDFARFFDQHGVADPDVFPLDLFFVVQGRAADGAAADHDRLERGDRRQRPGAADLDQDVEQTRFDPFRFVLESDRPARRLRGEPEDLALRKRIDLHDGAIGLIGKIVADPVQLVNRFQNFLDRVGEPPALAARQAEFF